MGIRLRRIWVFFWILPILGLVVFLFWAVLIPDPMAPAMQALQPDGEVEVVVGPWLTFQPHDRSPEVGLILYPGGRIDARAYAPAARAIAESGFLVVIVPMPLNLAFFSPDRAGDVIAAHPEIGHWAVGGHSLGGAMAARYARRHPGQIEGLLLWGAYPAASDDLSALPLQVSSIYGSLDRLVSAGEIEASRDLLPASTRWVPIEGGNHAQFGWYGDQPGDHPARISRQAQQAQIVAGSVALLEDLERHAP